MNSCGQEADISTPFELPCSHRDILSSLVTTTEKSTTLCNSIIYLVYSERKNGVNVYDQLNFSEMWTPRRLIVF